MALNMCEMCFSAIKIAFFPKNYKKRPTAGGFAPRPPMPSAAGGPGPRPSVCDMFELHWLSQNVSKATYLHFLTIDGLQLRHSFFSPKRLDVKTPLQSIGRYRKSMHNSFSEHI